ncbi:FCD domain-containing protein [Actinopolymorpha pittospori]
MSPRWILRCCWLRSASLSICRTSADHLTCRILETEAAASAALRISSAELDAAAELLRHNEAELTLDGPNHETMIENDIAFHRIVANAACNDALAALIDALGGRTMRDRLRRSISQPGADETSHG